MKALPELSCSGVKNLKSIHNELKDLHNYLLSFLTILFTLPIAIADLKSQQKELKIMMSQDGYGTWVATWLGCLDDFRTVLASDIYGSFKPFHITSVKTVVQVKQQTSWHVTSLYAMFSTVWSPYSKSVMRLKLITSPFNLLLVRIELIPVDLLKYVAKRLWDISCDLLWLLCRLHTNTCWHNYTSSCCPNHHGSESILHYEKENEFDSFDKNELLFHSQFIMDFGWNEIIDTLYYVK